MNGRPFGAPPAPVPFPRRLDRRARTAFAVARFSYQGHETVAHVADVDLTNALLWIGGAHRTAARLGMTVRITLTARGTKGIR